MATTPQSSSVSSHRLVVSGLTDRYVESVEPEHEEVSLGTGPELEDSRALRLRGNNLHRPRSPCGAATMELVVRVRHRSGGSSDVV